MPQAEWLEMQLREEIKRRFDEVLWLRRIKQKEAARQIGISPSRFSLYMKKRVTPSAFVLLKACKKWNLRIQHDGVEFRAKNPPKKQKSTRQMPEQLSLPLVSALKELGDESLDIRINKKGPDRLELSLEIKFAG